jgi:hypothetical protein
VTLTVGLATYRALHLLFGEASAWLQDETHPDERALLAARARFIASARVTAWKARFPMPVDATDRAVLADDLSGWADAPGLADFEFCGHGEQCACPANRPNDAIRLALGNLAQALTR